MLYKGHQHSAFSIERRNAAKSKMQSKVHQGVGRLCVSRPLVLLLDFAWRVKIYAAAGTGRELSPHRLETLLAVEGMCRVEILLFWALRLFRNSETAKKGAMSEGRQQNHEVLDWGLLHTGTLWQFV